MTEPKKLEYEEFSQNVNDLAKKFIETAGNHFPENEGWLEEDVYQIVHAALGAALMTQCVAMGLKKDEFLRLTESLWNDLEKHGVMDV